MQHFRLCTVTYGTAPAPFQSLRVLKQIAAKTDPDSQGVHKLLKQLSYVDDFFGGTDTVSQAVANRDALVQTLRNYKIELDKWSVNHPDLSLGLTTIDQSERLVNLNELTVSLV